MKHSILSVFHKSHSEVGRLGFLKVVVMLLTLFSFSFPTKANLQIWDGDFVYYVIGEGEVSIQAYTKSISGDITIPDKYQGYIVKTIAFKAFSGCTKITSITIPEGVKSIEGQAFDGCSSLQTITIPEGVESIGSSAFQGCSSLQTITIPEGVKSIGDYAFKDCSSLQTITIPKGVESIGSFAFQGCSSLQSITIGAKNISNSIFYNLNNLKYVTLLEGVESIGSRVFSACVGLESINIPSTVTSIGEYAFESCSNLTKAEFASVESLCGISFGNVVANPLFFAKHLYINNSEVTQLVIPESVTSIGAYAFILCESINQLLFKAQLEALAIMPLPVVRVSNRLATPVKMNPHLANMQWQMWII